MFSKIDFWKLMINCIPYKIGLSNYLSSEQNITKEISVRPIIERPYIDLYAFNSTNGPLLCGPLVSIVREFIKREKSL